MSASSVPVLVIGAGPAGIGAAVRLRELGIEHLVVDAGEAPGGMAASTTDEHGFTWDLGGHVIHSHFPSFDRAVRDSGAAVRDVERNGWVWMRGDDRASMVPAPVQAQLAVIPDDLDPDAPAAHLADYYRNCFGADLYARFFEPYNRKMWTIPLEEVDAAWTSHRSGGTGRNVPELSLAADSAGRPRETFPYPVGGTGALWAGIVENLADASSFRFGVSVTAIDAAARTATLSDGTRVRYEHLVSTAPLPWLLRQLEHDEDADLLRASAEVAIGLGYEGEVPEALRDVTWLYCPDPAVPWFRGTVMSTYDPSTAGEGRWSMLLEVPRLDGRDPDVDEAARACAASLAVLGADPDRLVSVWSRRLPMAYPVPTLGRDDVLRRADAALTAHGIRSRGRFGGWRYESCNQDYAYAQGIQAVDAALTGSEEDVLWEPEAYRSSQ